MAEKDPNKKGFRKEFKEFISKGSVVDLAVGVLVGGAFTSIVNALTDSILRPIINWIFTLFGGDKALEGAYTVLKAAYTEDGALDLTNSIYINWGAFITAIINFLLIALVLFWIIKIINSIKNGGHKLDDKIKAVNQKVKEGAEKQKAKIQAKKDGVAETNPEEEKSDEEAEK